MKTLRLSVLLSAIFAISIAATQAFAQEVNTAKADELLRQAAIAEEQASNSASADMKYEAARLHLESAKYRAEGDPQAVASIRSAAFYLAYSRPARAADLLIQAAERALAANDPVMAANTYVDAANVLISSHNNRLTPSDFAKAQTWMSQAATIATDPVFSEVQRDRVIRRVGLDEGQFAG